MRADGKPPEIQELCEVLRRQAEICRQWLALLGRERASLLSPELPRIQELLQEKEALIAAGRRLEERRNRLLGALENRPRGAAAEASLGEIAAALGGAAREELLGLRAELRGLLSRMADEHRRNAALCRQGLALAREAHRRLQGLIASESVYLPSGRLEEARLQGRLLRGEG